MSIENDNPSALPEQHDACSVGTIVNINGEPTRRVIEQALTALATTVHRSGVAPDGKTGDGVGIQTGIPQEFFKDEYQKIKGFTGDTDLGVGTFFLPRENGQARQRCKEIIAEKLSNAGYKDFAWRKTPVNPETLGDVAEENRPHIEQLLIPQKNGVTKESFERDLYVLRRGIEKQVQAEKLSGEGSDTFYVPSMSSQSIVYKGMTLATDLAEFYPDLNDDKFTSARAIFHSRFSTNTAPVWSLAHPYRYLSHNGEVNTVIGNRNAMHLHATRLADAFGEDFETIAPIIEAGRSDSADVDAAIELYSQAGMSLPAIKSIMVPEAVHSSTEMSEAVRDMYEYIDATYEPWDGPATLAMSDGKMVLIGGDRNGLRPVRYSITKDGLLVAGSEDGMADLDQSQVIEKGNLGPGNMIAVDLQKGQLLRDTELKEQAAKELASETSLAKKIKGVEPDSVDDPHIGLPALRGLDKQSLRKLQRLAGYTEEDVEDIINPMARDGKEALGAMGDDTPPAILSKKHRPLADFFYQRFAQVTNPPLDSIRERSGMSLTTHLGSFYTPDGQVLDNDVLRLETPILTNRHFAAVQKAFGDNLCEIDCTFDINGGPSALRLALDEIKAEAEEAALEGKHIVLTDQHAKDDRAVVPMILASGGVHTHLMNEGLRKQTSVNVRSAECHDVHNTACLIGMGADTVNPYLAEETVVVNNAQGWFDKGNDRPPLDESLGNLYKSLEDGLLKIMGKMGVSPVSSYRMARLFECIGLSQDMMDEFMPGVKSPVSGMSMDMLQDRITKHHTRNVNRLDVPILNAGGKHKTVQDGEIHADTGLIIKKLQTSIAVGGEEGYALYKEYTQMIEDNAAQDPVRLRDLMKIRTGQSVPLEQVESEEEIITRFMSGAMSIGALSPAAHGVITRSMNNIGARSNSGEGGAFPEFYGTESDPSVKQITSGRFGVTAPYLVNARELERKVAQGAKPGEGGQIMGKKVYGDIPRLRNCEPGTTLVSPPPNHDEYSIEDHAQTHYDLKQINAHARTRTKLVSTTGVGTVAAGVEKCGVDTIHIAGGDGGTGASPKSSLKHCGLPFEIGLAEANQVLTKSGSREKVFLSTDGGMRRGRDVLVAAHIGAEEFSFGTLLMEATGCLLMRQCFSNKCAVGVATQNPKLIDHFPTFDGEKKTTEYTEKMIETLMHYIARDIREQLAEAGHTSLNDVIGRTDLLKHSKGRELGLDLSSILQPPNPGGVPLHCQLKPGERKEILHPKNPNRITVDQGLLDAHPEDILSGRPCEFTVDIGNEDRAIGARISYHLIKKFNNVELPMDTVKLNLSGIAGQSLGAFAAHGLTLDVTGGANDFVGKGLSGATIVVKPEKNSPISDDTTNNIIVGNVSLIGATAGSLYAAGQAGNRFAVRNSGATAVVEGMGESGCNYMTAGRIISLGEVGNNFGSGMTGGEAFVYDPDSTLEKRANEDVRVSNLVNAEAIERLRQDIEEDAQRTGSTHAQSILDDWDNAVLDFKHITPACAPTTEVEETPVFA